MTSVFHPGANRAGPAFVQPRVPRKEADRPADRAFAEVSRLRTAQNLDAGEIEGIEVGGGAGTQTGDHDVVEKSRCQRLETPAGWQRVTDTADIDVVDVRTQVEHIHANSA